MSNNIVQLTDYNDNNIYPIAGAAAQGSITKTMLDEGVFVGAELSDPGNIAYVGTADIQDDAVTTAKIADLNVTEGKLASNSVTTSKIADGSVTSDKIDWATLEVVNLSGYIGPAVTEVTRANLYKFGRICILNITCRLSAYTANNFAYILRGLPSSLRPSENFEAFAFCSTTYTAMRGLVNTAGELAIIGGESIASGSYYNVSGTYIVPA